MPCLRSMGSDLFLSGESDPLELGSKARSIQSMSHCIRESPKVDPGWGEADMALGQNVELLIRIINPFEGR